MAAPTVARQKRTTAVVVRQEGEELLEMAIAVPDEYRAAQVSGVTGKIDARGAIAK